MEMVLVAGNVGNSYAFKVGDKYLSANTSSGQGLLLVNSLTNAASFTVTFSSSTATIVSNASHSFKSLAYYSSTFRCRSSGTSFRIYKSSASPVADSWTGEQQAKSYASYFLSQTAEGCSLRSESKLSSVWANLKAEYTFMVDEAKEAFVSSSDATIAEAKARYLVCLQEHPSLEAFVLDGEGNYLALQQAAFVPYSIDNSHWMIAIVTLFGCSSLGLLVYLRKRRKEQ